MSVRIGVDLGGTKTEAVAVRISEAKNTSEIVARRRIPTEREKGYEHIVEATRALVLDVADEAGLATRALPPIGIGMPGAVTRAGLVKNSNTTCLNGRPFRDDLARALAADGADPKAIAFANDANCFALAEATWGAARGARVAFGVILGTGVGGGLIAFGKIWEGAHGIAGEWGHVVLDPETGPACYCGKRGCVETYLSGPAIEQAYAARTGSARPLADIAADARDDVAVALMKSRLDVFGRALATVIDVVDPDVVVLGGGVSNVDALYDEGVRAVARWVFNDTLETRIVKNALGDSAGVLGAALLTC